MEIQLYDETNNISQKQTKLITGILNYAERKLDLAENSELSITIVDNEQIRKINRDYRNKDAATDVISFAINESVDDEFDILDMAEFTDMPHEFGDLFISIERMKEQAEEYGHSEDRELAFLTVHGFLHLNGYDHQTEVEEKEMFALQEEILEEFGLTR